MESLIQHVFLPRQGKSISMPGGRLWNLRCAGVILLAFLPFFLGEQALHLAVSGGVMALAAMALTILSGSAGLPSLGTAAFLAIGAFVTGIMATQFDVGLLPSMGISAVLGLVVGALIGLLTLRVSGLYLAVGTLALQHIVQIIATTLDLKLTYASGFMLDAPELFGITLDSLWKWWAFVLILLVLLYFPLRHLLRTHIGREWHFLHLYPSAASALGVASVATRLKVFALTSAIIAMVGAVDGYRIGNVQAASYTVHLAVVYLTVVVLGGAGNLLGAIFASYLIVLLPTIISGVMGALSIDTTSRAAGLEGVAIGLILVFALLRVPQRLIALWQARGGHHESAV